MLLRAIYRKYLSFNMLYQRFEGIILNLNFLQYSFSIKGHNFEDLKNNFFLNEDEFYSGIPSSMTRNSVIYLC